MCARPLRSRRMDAAQTSNTAGTALRAPGPGSFNQPLANSRRASWPALAVQISRLARKRGVDPEELIEPFLQIRLLPFQQLDLLQTFLTAERQRVGVGIP